MAPYHSYQFPFARYPAVRIVLLLTAGIILSEYLPMPALSWALLFILLLGGRAVTSLLSQRSLSMSCYYLTISLYILLIIAFGGAWFKFHPSLRDHPPPSKLLLDRYTWEQVTVTGTLRQLRQSAVGKYHLDLDVDTTIFAGPLRWHEKYRSRAILDPRLLSRPGKLKLGYRLRLKTTVYPLEGSRNPSRFDYRTYLERERIFTQMGVDTLLQIRQQQPFGWSSLRQATHDLIDRTFSLEASALAKALLVGYKNELGAEQKQAFSRSGLAHIMAVSGLHIGFLLVPFWFLIPYFWTLKTGRLLALFILCALLYLYAGLTGFSASVTRAAVTGGFLIYGRLFNKAGNSVNLTAVAAVIILLLDPSELFSLGFQLSFTAVFIILLTLPVLKKMLFPRAWHRWYGTPLTILWVSFIVQLGLYPLLAWYFGEFSLVGPLANGLAVPLLMVVVPYSLLLLPLSGIMPSTGRFLNTPNSYILEWLDTFVHHFSSWNFSWVETPPVTPVLLLLWAGALFFIASLAISGLRWKMAVIFLLACCIQQGLELKNKVLTPRLHLTFFDVGQGDAALVTTPGGKHFLIDTGPRSTNFSSARRSIIPYLEARGINRLDAVFLTHPHADHIGGVVDLLQSVAVDTLYDSGYEYDSSLYRQYLAAANAREVPIVHLRAGTILKTDPALRIFVYGPHRGPPGSDPNQHSLVVELIYGNTEMLFMGDAGHRQEKRVLSHYGDLLNTDLLKAGHHGSRSSSSSPFIDIATPDISVISLAWHNRFRHPHPAAVRRLRRAGGTLYFTSLEGALLLDTDGETLWRRTW